MVKKTQNIIIVCIYHSTHAMDTEQYSFYTWHPILHSPGLTHTSWRFWRPSICETQMKSRIRTVSHFFPFIIIPVTFVSFLQYSPPGSVISKYSSIYSFIYVCIYIIIKVVYFSSLCFISPIYPHLNAMFYFLLPRH